MALPGSGAAGRCSESEAPVLHRRGRVCRGTPRPVRVGFSLGWAFGLLLGFWAGSGLALDFTWLDLAGFGLALLLAGFGLILQGFWLDLRWILVRYSFHSSHSSLRES